MTRRQGNGNEKRDRAGVTVTMVDRHDGRTLTVVQEGLTREALGLVCDRFDANEWAVQTVSTRRTILADLRGRKPYLIGYEPEPSPTASGARRIFERVSVEATLLGQIGRMEFLP